MIHASWLYSRIEKIWYLIRKDVRLYSYSFCEKYSSTSKQISLCQKCTMPAHHLKTRKLVDSFDLHILFQNSFMRIEYLHLRINIRKICYCNFFEKWFIHEIHCWFYEWRRIMLMLIFVIAIEDCQKKLTFWNVMSFAICCIDWQPFFNHIWKKLIILVE
jgi:hypothetical protein